MTVQNTEVMEEIAAQLQENTCKVRMTHGNEVVQNTDRSTPTVDDRKALKSCHLKKVARDSGKNKKCLEDDGYSVSGILSLTLPDEMACVCSAGRNWHALIAAWIRVYV